MFKSIVMAAVMVAGLLVGTTSARAADEAKDAKKERFFELRIYSAAEGKLDALNARFREHTNALFARHGMEIVGFWTSTGDGKQPKNTLYYILAYPSKEAREKSWKEFNADPDWKVAREASERNGKLVTKVESIYLNPTDYSPIK
jgi:hypothetical protein